MGAWKFFQWGWKSHSSNSLCHVLIPIHCIFSSLASPKMSSLTTFDCLDVLLAVVLCAKLVAIQISRRPTIYSHPNTYNRCSALSPGRMNKKVPSTTSNRNATSTSLHRTITIALSVRQWLLPINPSTVCPTVYFGSHTLGLTFIQEYRATKWMTNRVWIAFYMQSHSLQLSNGERWLPVQRWGIKGREMAGKQIPSIRRDRPGPCCISA